MRAETIRRLSAGLLMTGTVRRHRYDDKVRFDAE